MISFYGIAGLTGYENSIPKARIVKSEKTYILLAGV
jgi:hypothetical protein